MVLKHLILAAALALVFLLILQSFQPARTNPVSDPRRSFDVIAKPSPQVASILKRACNDCHSNNTVWPWYSHIAPVSWAIARDVREGRAHLNLSEWTRVDAEGEKPDLGELCEQARAGKMPPRSYTRLHPQAKLSGADIAVLCTLGATSRTGKQDEKE